MDDKELIGSVVKVHKILGTNQLETAYEKWLDRNFLLKQIVGNRQIELPLFRPEIGLEN